MRNGTSILSLQLKLKWKKKVENELDMLTDKTHELVYFSKLQDKGLSRIINLFSQLVEDLNNMQFAFAIVLKTAMISDKALKVTFNKRNFQKGQLVKARRLG